MTDNQIQRFVREGLIKQGMLANVAYKLEFGMTNKLGTPTDAYRVVLSYLYDGVATGIQRGAVFSYVDSKVLEDEINNLILQLKKDIESYDRTENISGIR